MIHVTAGGPIATFDSLLAPAHVFNELFLGFDND